jgi:hypothetical protein
MQACSAAMIALVIDLMVHACLYSDPFITPGGPVRDQRDSNDRQLQSENKTDWQRQSAGEKKERKEKKKL